MDTPKRLILEGANDHSFYCEVACRTESHNSSLPNTGPLKYLKAEKMCETVRTKHFMGKISQAVKLRKLVIEESRETVRPVGLDWPTWTKDPTVATAPMPDDTTHMFDIWNIIYEDYIEASGETLSQNTKGTQSSHIIWNPPEIHALPEVKCNVEAVHNETQRKSEGQIDSSTKSRINKNVTQDSVYGLPLSEEANDDAKDKMLSEKEEIDVVHIAEDNYSTGDLCDDTIIDETHEGAEICVSSSFSAGNVDVNKTSPNVVNGNNTQCDLVNKNAITNRTSSNYHITKLNSEFSNSNIDPCHPKGAPLDKYNVEDLNSDSVIAQDSHKAALSDKEREEHMVCHETDRAKLLCVSNKDHSNVSVTHTAGYNSVAIQTCRCLSDLNLISICSSCIQHVPPFGDISKLYNADPEDMNSCEMEGLENKSDISCARESGDVGQRNTTGRQREVDMEVLALEISAQDLLEPKEAVREKDDDSTTYSTVKCNDHSKDVILAGVDNLNQERHEAGSVQKLNPTNSCVSNGESKSNAVDELDSDSIDNTEVGTCESGLALRNKEIKSLGYGSLLSSYQLYDDVKDEFCISKYDTKIPNKYDFTRHKDIAKLPIDDTNDNIFSTGGVIRGSASEARGMPEPGLQQPSHSKTDWLQSHPDDSLKVREAIILDEMDAHTNVETLQVVPIRNCPSETPCARSNNAASEHGETVSSHDSHCLKTFRGPQNNAQSYQDPPINVPFIDIDAQEQVTDNAENDQCCNTSTIDPAITEDMLSVEECKKLVEKLNRYNQGWNDMKGNESEQKNTGTTKDYSFVDSTPSCITAECSQAQQAEATVLDVGHVGLDRLPRAIPSKSSGVECSLYTEGDGENVVCPIKGIPEWKSEFSLTKQGYDHHHHLYTGFFPRQEVPENKLISLKTSTGPPRLGLSKFAKIKRLHPYLN